MGVWRVLLVDDERDFVLTLAERMELRGIDVKVAFDGIQAIEKLDDEQPDLVVLDLLMPGMTGLDMLRHIRKTQPQTPVIVLTGLGSPEYCEEASRLGAYECILKPVDIDVLIEKMIGALDVEKAVT